MYKDVGKRIMALLLSVCMIAGMMDLSGFTVRAANDWFARVEVSGDYEYTGSAHEPKGENVKVYSGRNTLVDESKYTLSYNNNINATTGSQQAEVIATPTTEAESEYGATSATGKFSISSKNIAGATVKVTGRNDETELVVQGATNNLSSLMKVVVELNGNTLFGEIETGSSINSSFEYTYTLDSNSISSTDGDEKIITVTVTGRNNYTGITTGTIKVKRLDESQFKLVYNNDPSVTEIQDTGLLYFDGSPVEADAQITNSMEVKYKDEILNKGTYKLVCEKNTTASRNQLAEIYAIGNDGTLYAGFKSNKIGYEIEKSFYNPNTPEEKRIRGTVDPQSFLGTNAHVEPKAEAIHLYDPDFAEPLEENKDYTISGYGPNNSMGERAGSVTLQGIGAYTGEITLYFEIKATVLSDGMITIDDSNCIYDRTDQYKNLKVSVAPIGGTESYQEGIDYTLAHSNNNNVINAGNTYTVTITPTGTGQLQGSAITKNYTVHPRSLSDSEVIVENISPGGAVIYNGNPQPHKPVVTYKGVTLSEGGNRDYSLTYLNKRTGQTGDYTNAGTIEVTVEGKNNFTGTVTRSYDIQKQTINQTNCEITNIPNKPYTGEPITQSPVVKVANRELRADVDYEIGYGADNTNAGTVKMTITGIGNYDGNATAEFEIEKRDITNVNQRDVNSPEYYTGNEIRAAVTYRLGNYTLIEGTDYDLSYEDNIKVGTGKVTITGKGNFKGSETRTFTISPRNIGTGDFLIVKATGGANGRGEYTLSDSSALDSNYFEYKKGQEVKPSTVTVEYVDDSLGINRPLTEGTDYELSYGKCDEIGTVTITISGRVNWSGTKQVQYKIKGNFGDYGSENALTSINIPTQIYTGKEIIPENAEVTFDGSEPLILGKDFEVKNCTNNTDVNTRVLGTPKAVAEIHGMGNYYGEARNVFFDIRPLNLSTDTPLEDNKYIISNVLESYRYSGLEINPVPDIKHHENPLTKDIDYEINYNPDGVEHPNVDVTEEGKPWKLRITGIGNNYEGSVDIPFDIEPYDIGAEEAKIELAGVDDYVVLDWLKNANAYPDITTRAALSEDGEHVIWPELKLIYTPEEIDGTVREDLEAPLTDADYDVVYEANDTLGKATITITGKGNFTGTITKEFWIRGDLAGSNTRIEVEKDWVYRPESAGGNTPKTDVIYTIYNADGITVKEEITFEKDTDYTIEYAHNTDATKGAGENSALPEGVKAEVNVTAVSAEDGSATGRAVNGSKAEFDILQKDISKALADGDEKDPDLVVSGIDENGYEYTGSEIVPDFMITYLEKEELTKKSAEQPADYDYEVTAYNNTDIWDKDTGELSDTYAMLSARRNEDGAYNGNYYGEFKAKFTIKPREISSATIDLPDHLIKNSRIAPVGTVIDEGSKWIGALNENGEWECDYTRRPITFPKEGKELAAPEYLSDGLEIIWYRDGIGEFTLKENEDYTIEYKNNQGIGDGEILITAKEKSNYQGSYTKTFKIMASITEVLNDPPRYMDLSYDKDVPYGKVDVYPELKFEDKTGFNAGERPDYKILEEGEDFEIVTEANHTDLKVESYSVNNKEVADENSENPPTLVVAGKGHYRGNITIKYNIVPKDFEKEDSGITVEFVGCIPNDEQYTNAYIYDGQPKGKIRVYNNDPKKIGTDGYNIYDNNRILEEDIDFRVLEWTNNTEISTEDSKASVTIEGLGPNYKGIRKVEFTIVPQPINAAEATVSRQTFNRTEQKPEVTVRFNGNTLEEGKDYTILEYKNNVNASTSVELNEERPTVIIQGAGGYGGTKTIYFDIDQEEIGNEDDIEAVARAIYIEGEPVKPVITVHAKDGTVLVENEDYTVDEYTGPEEINALGTITIHGIGNYKGERELGFRIYPPDGEFVIEPIEPQEFRNAPIKPEVKVSLVVDESMSLELVEGTDYVLEYDNIINAGVDSAVVIAKGLGYFAEQNKQAATRFTITPKSIGSEGTIDSAMTLSSIEPQWYGGRPIVPGVELKFQPSSQQQPAIREGEETNNPVTLIQGTDYRVTAVNNTMVGEATATITGIGNYTGTIETKFRIHGNMNMVDVAPIPTQDYTGSPVTPVPQVSIGGKAMVEGTDYRVDYSDNVDRGTATITITGTEDWYFGTKIVKFDIARELSSETAVRGVAAVYTYTGAAITPPVRVEDDGNLLVSGVDYDIAYSENVNAGTATITITGKGKYTGGTTASFKISPQQLGRAKISPISDQIYNGQEQNPPITVTAGNTALENGKDYSVVYVNSAAPGMASVIVKGEGNYTGTQTVNYNIKVPEITGVKVSKYTNKSMTLSWNKNDVVSGYEIYNSKNRRAVRVNKPTTAKGTISKLKAGTAQTFRVRAYVNKDGQYYYGPFTSVKGATAPNSTKISSLKSAKKKQVTVKWKKVKGATQYEVYRSTSKKGKYKKLATTKKTSYTDKKATGGKKYYYKIRVCKKIDKKNYYSSYSAVKSVKAKK